MHFSAALRSLSLAAAVIVFSATVVATPVSTAETAPSAKHSVYLATGEIVAAEDAPVVIARDVFASPETKYVKRRGFNSSCKDCGISMGSLGCYCRKVGEPDAWSQLDLAECLVNNRGTVEWRRNGAFSASCGSVRWMPPSRIVIDLCKDGSGAYMWNIIDLDDRIHNYNGVLSCDVAN